MKAVIGAASPCPAYVYARTAISIWVSAWHGDGRSAIAALDAGQSRRLVLDFVQRGAPGPPPARKYCALMTTPRMSCLLHRPPPPRQPWAARSCSSARRWRSSDSSRSIRFCRAFYALSYDWSWGQVGSTYVAWPFHRSPEDPIFYTAVATPDLGHRRPASDRHRGWPGLAVYYRSPLYASTGCLVYTHPGGGHTRHVFLWISTTLGLVNVPCGPVVGSLALTLGRTDTPLPW